jgi:hypothetical protein
MARGTPILNSFISGELTPELDGRTDLKAYNTGCSSIRNMKVLPTGGVTKRSGTYYISETKDSTKPVKLIPFEYSTTQAYVLEFGHEYIRFYTDGGQVTLSGSAYEIASPYNGNDVSKIKYVQSADTMYLVHPDYPVRKLERYGAANWLLTDVDFYFGPFLSQNEDTDVVVTSSAITGQVSVTISGSTFDEDMVGGLFQIAGQRKVEKSASGANQWTDAFFVENGESFIFSVNGTWSATVTVQKSYDQGDNWVDYVESTYNVAVEITEESDDVYFRAGIKTGDYTSGTVEIKLTMLNEKGYMSIDSYIDANTISGTVLQDFPNTDETYKWSEGAWSNYNGFLLLLVSISRDWLWVGMITSPKPYGVAKQMIMKTSRQGHYPLMPISTH